MQHERKFLALLAVVLGVIALALYTIAEWSAQLGFFGVPIYIGTLLLGAFALPAALVVADYLSKHL